MDNELSQKTLEIKDISYGKLLYFTLFAVMIYLSAENLVYAICFSSLLTGCLNNLCRNKLSKFLGYIVSIPVALLWLNFNRLLYAKIIDTVQSSTVKNVLVFKIANNMPIVQAVVFCIVLVILTVIIQKLLSQLPEFWKFPEKFQVIIVFVVNFVRLLLLAVILSTAIYYGLQKIKFRG